MYYELMQNMIDVIKRKNESIEFYKRFLPQIPSEEERAVFQKRILSDEIKHMKMFTALFTKFIGSLPNLPEAAAEIPEDFNKCLEIAAKHELESIDLYRGIMLATQESYIRDFFLEAVMDEMEHAMRILFLYKKNG